MNRLRGLSDILPSSFIQSPLFGTVFEFINDVGPLKKYLLLLVFENGCLEILYDVFRILFTSGWKASIELVNGRQPV